MKSIFNFPVLFILIVTLFGCNSEKSDTRQSKTDWELIPSGNTFDNQKITSIIEEYIDNNKETPRVYTMLVQRENVLMTSFQLCAIKTYSELHKLVPSDYFWVKDNIVLVYTGLERLSKKDDKFLTRLEGIVGDRLADDLSTDGKTKTPNYPMIFDPSTWQVRVSGDSVTVERGVMNLLGPPVVNSLKFVAPKK